MRRAGLLAAALAACAGPPADGGMLPADAIRFSYFRFDEVLGPGRIRWAGPSAWIVFSRTWVRRFGTEITEPWIKAFPRDHVVRTAEKENPFQRAGRGVLIATGIHPDAELERHLRQILRMGLLEIPEQSMTAEEVLRRHEQAKARPMALPRIIRISTDRGSRTIVLTGEWLQSLSKETAARYLALEAYVASAATRLAIVAQAGTER